MSIISASAIESSLDYLIERSVRLRSSASAYFNRTPASAGNRQTWTWSGWVKRGTLGVLQTLFGCTPTTGTDTTYFRVLIDVNNKLSIGRWSAIILTTTQVFRDPSAWYHIVVRLDTTNATSTERLAVFVNGSRVANFDVNSIIILNELQGINQASQHNLGSSLPNAGNYFDGYLTDVNFIDGQALTPSSFGQNNPITGVWEPMAYTGTYGTNGFYLNFSDPSAATAAAIGKDYSGNGNNWTPNNISVTAGVTYDSMIDVPTPYADGGNGRGNYCVLNPLSRQAVTISDGNLGFSGTGTLSATTTFAYPLSGKWHCEFQITSTPEGSTNELIGFGPVDVAGGVTRAYASNGQWFNGSAWVSFGSAWSTNDVIGVAADVDGSQISIYKNGTLQGTAQSYTFADSAPQLRTRASGTTVMNANFGQRPFAYTPPTGFKALNTQNLPEPTIVDGSQYFDATTYTGNGTTQSIVNSGGMQPDLVWVKVRSAAYDNRLFDSSRPLNAWLSSNLTNAEINSTLNDNFLSYNSNGFSVGPTSATNGLNQSGQTFVGWQWKANGAGVSNTDGSITSTVSAGVTQGFSVVTYTGTGANATVGHGLGVAPKMVIVKLRSPSGGAWGVYHASVGPTGALFLDQTAAVNTFSTFWNNTAPTSTVFTIGSNGNINQVNPFVAYCFAEVPGFSKFGSYTGNGSADGPFVFCGFRPRFVLIKRTDSTGYWQIIDTSRSPYNVANATLYPNASLAEDSTNTNLDALANGYKIRGTPSTDFNTSGSTYIYAAFAENPFKHSLAR